MERESRKRKMEKDDDEEEEEKMEKFFALIRSAREVRELMIRGANRSKEEELEKKKDEKEEEKKKDEKEKSMAVLKPSFQPEDFMVQEGAGGDKSKFPRTNLGAGPSKREDETRKEEDKDGGGGDHGLDLELSL